jgi:flagellar hook-associated protein 2
VSSAVDGLVSGLSTSSLISQLMTVEAAPQTRLKSKVTTAQTVAASYQSVNAQVAGLKTAADTLGQLSTWRGISTTSTSPSVTATALTGTNGSAGTTTFDVKALAKSQISTVKVDKSADITSADSFTVTVGPVGIDADGKPTEKTVTVNLTKKTAQGVADALNAAGIGVKAAVITTGGAQNILQFSGTKTGVDNGFQIGGELGLTLNNVATASNAELEIGGGEAAGGYNVTSDTNTFAKLMPGVSLTVSKLETGVTVTSQQDVNGIAAKFQAMVDSANAMLTQISNQTAYNPTTKAGSPLTGDFAVRTMSQTVLSKISQGLVYDNPAYDKTKPISDTNLEKIKFGSLSQLGIELDRSGQLTFDAGKFTASYNANPAAIQQAGVALGDQFEDMAGKMTTTITSVITGRKSEIDNLTSQISNWDVRLATKRTALQKQYSDLEVSLGKLKNQSSWLSGQLAGLG